MALEARLAVTQPYHGPGGELIYDVGHEFPLDAELPYGVLTHLTAAQVPAGPAAEPEPAAEPDPADAPPPVKTRQKGATEPGDKPK